jgi:hypothetical protein
MAVKRGAAILAVRCHEALLTKLDGWRRAQSDAPTRAIAIRRLAENALAGTSSRQRSRGSKRKAAEMAEQAIDPLGDHEVTDKERAGRKRRLIRGPQEFRHLRRHQPKAKD